jgi:chitinase
MKNIFLKALVCLLILGGERVKAQTHYSDYTPCPKRIIAYFASWGDRPDKGNYGVSSIPWNKITHINYAFAAVGNNSKIKLLDSAVSIKNVLPGQDNVLSYKGQFNLLTVYKKQYPTVKTLISIGGWSESGGFYDMSATAQGRETFSKSCLDFLHQYGFDGIDLDWEYPTSAAGATSPLDEMMYYNKYSTVVYGNYLSLLKRLKQKLDSAGVKDNKKYLLTIAAPASGWTLSGMELAEHCKYIDFLNLMTYDLHGAWNSNIGPQAALYASYADPETSAMDQPTLNVDWAVKYYSGIMHPSKINIGIPYYSRGWTDVTGGTNGLWGQSPKLTHTYTYNVNGTTYTKNLPIGKGAGGMDGIWNDPAPEPDAGANPLWHVLNLLSNPGTATYGYLAGTPLAGPQTGLSDYTRYFDNTTKSVYVWNPIKKIFFTYEDTVSLSYKLDYIVKRGLGGMMFWELSGDYHYDATLKYYTTGHDMTDFAAAYFKKSTLVPATGRNGLPAANNSFSYSFTGSYSHPNYTPHFYIKNTSGTAITGGWTVEFDLPKSARWDQTWGSGTLSVVDTLHPFWKRYKIVGPTWQTLNPGDSVDITGAIKLDFSRGPLNVVFNGATSIYEYKILPDLSCSIPTSIISDDKNKADWSVYPNPNSGIFTVTNFSANPHVLRVFDARGALVHQQYLQQGNTILNVTFLRPGMYILQLEADGKVGTYKKIIVRD